MLTSFSTGTAEEIKSAWTSSSSSHHLSHSKETNYCNKKSRLQSCEMYTLTVYQTQASLPIPKHTQALSSHPAALAPALHCDNRGAVHRTQEPTCVLSVRCSSQRRASWREVRVSLWSVHSHFMRMVFVLPRL